MSDDREPPSGPGPRTDAGGTDGAEAGQPVEPPVSPRLVSRVRTLIDILDTEIAGPYRVELFRILAPGLLADGPGPATPTVPETAPRPSQPSPRAPQVDARLDRRRLDFAPYARVLAQPGKNLLKALVALETARDQLEIEWVTPAEVERLLADRAGVRSVYRTNLGNALSKAPGMADRRRRGRGYEYRITALGQETLHREAALLGG